MLLRSSFYCLSKNWKLNFSLSSCDGQPASQKKCSRLFMGHYLWSGNLSSDKTARYSDEWLAKRMRNKFNKISCWWRETESKSDWTKETEKTTNNKSHYFFNNIYVNPEIQIFLKTNTQKPKKRTLVCCEELSQLICDIFVSPLEKSFAARTKNNELFKWWQ